MMHTYIHTYIHTPHTHTHRYSNFAVIYDSVRRVIPKSCCLHLHGEDGGSMTLQNVVLPHPYTVS